MSIAGTVSSQGYEYQILIALHWLIRLLDDDKIEYIQVESTGLPGEDIPVTVDDIVIMYEDGSACFIQAKKNQTNHKAWSLSDKTLQHELKNARDQLNYRENSEIKFYSRSSFGELKSLVEHCKRLPDFSSFLRNKSKNKNYSHLIEKYETLKKLSNIFECSKEETFYLSRRISFGPPHELQDWNRYNLADLDRLVPKADVAIDVLKELLRNHAASLRDSKYCITRDDVLEKLRQKEIYPTPKRSEAEILETFKSSSNIGRNWLRTIDGKPIPRPELDRIIELIEQETKTILLVDGPGSGKTCLLLDLADRIEKERSSHWGLLFIKGDWFTDIKTESDLVARDLPEDIAGQCARLAAFRQVVVIIDSLDVLSLSRQHSALKVFLGLIDRLEKVKNITVITACRKFDLDYDPLLRGREWKHKVNLQPLDFESVVKPFLDRWGVDSSSIGLELKELLKLPQNLSIYGKLANRGIKLQPTSAYELYNDFIEEVVAKNLGDEALAALQNMAEDLVNQRSLSCTKAAFNSSEDIVRQLISEEILLNNSDDPHVLIFRHQTLRDCLMVRAYVAQKKTLTEFIVDRPQFPFIRPTVRAFFFYLRASAPKSFRQEVRKVLSHKEVAYHVKRLICESFAEIVPVEEDRRLLLWIFREYPDLFRRFLSRLEGNAWFEILNSYWLPKVQQSQDKEKWLDLFCWKLKVWLDRYPTEVIALWREAIASPWTDRQTLVRSISISLEELNLWKIEGLRELLESLVEYASDRRLEVLGRCVSKWVQATNSGDDLLWKYITRNVLPEDTKKWELNHKLCCEPYQFCQDNFLTERINKSDVLLALVLNDLECWSADAAAASYEQYSLAVDFLDNTSWDTRRHSSSDIRSAESLTALLDSLETALKQRASENDAWWQENEPYWRGCHEPAIRYFLILAYQENIEANIAGIEAQLQDERLFSWGELNDELGELMQKAYPYISDTVRIANQSLILSLHDDLDTNSREKLLWAASIRYQLLVWIPSIFRIPETQSFIDDWQDCFDYPNFSGDIKVKGRIVGPPISSEELLKLSDKALLPLLHYYKDCRDTDVFDYHGVKRVLSEACSITPERFLNLFDLFIQEGFQNSYVLDVIEGIGMHLRDRSNNLQQADRIPEGETLAANLLNWLERYYPLIWENTQTVSQALEACCQVLNDPESADRLTLLLFWARNCSQEDIQIGNRQEDLATHTLNSARGIAANSAMTLCNKLLEKEQPLPELLPSLVHNFARDPAIYARVPVLWHLPFLTYKKPEWGWQLLADVFQEPQPRLWKCADRFFYYQYRNRFDLVDPYLKRLFNEGMEEAGEIWGRISALASLAGDISQEKLLDILLKTGNTDACEGVVRVFVANFDLHEHTAACRSGLMTILGRENLSNKIILQLEKLFREETETNRGLIERHLAVAFLEASGKVETYNFYGFLEWLGYKANLAPLVALEIAEILAEKLNKEWKGKTIGHTQPLISVLNEILREADETDDPELVQRAINLQDCFLKLDIYRIEEFFTEAERE